VVACGGGAREAKPPAEAAQAAPAPVAQASAPALAYVAVSPIPVGPADASWGSPLAPVTIVAFLDLECPFSQRVQPTLQALMETYGPQRIRLVVKHLPMPFHHRAEPAASMAQLVFDVAGDQAFLAFVAKAFAAYHELSDENLRRWATEVGVSEADLSIQNLSRAGAKVRDDMVLGRDIGAYDTPTFFINGDRLRGAEPQRIFTSVIDQEQVFASARLEAGVSAEQLYAERSAEQFQLLERPKEKYKGPDNTVWRIPVDADDPARGGKEPLVTIVEFGDFECRFSRRVEPTLNDLLERYGDDLRVVWKDSPLALHPHAQAAAALGRAAYEKGSDTLFWQAHAALFGPGALDDESLGKIATSLGLAASAHQQELGSRKFQSKLRDTELLAVDFEARRTPHFFINGRRLSGAQSAQGFQRVVDEQLRAAAALVEGGVPRSGLYAAIMQSAEGPPPLAKRAVPAAIPRPAPARGPASAKVTIIEFASFACQLSKRVEPTLSELLEKYPKQIRIEWHYLPSSSQEHGMLAAEAAHEVFTQQGATGFFRYHDRLFEQQEDLSRPALERLAAEQKVDLPRFQRALSEHTHRARVEADVVASKEAGVTGTPRFLVGDYFVSGEQPPSVLERAVEAALADSKR